MKRISLEQPGAMMENYALLGHLISKTILSANFGKAKTTAIFIREMQKGDLKLRLLNYIFHFF